VALVAARASTRPLLTSTCAVSVTETTQRSQCIPQKVLTLSHKVDECKPLVAASLTTAAGGARSGTGRGVIENKHSTRAESSHPPLRVCMSVNPLGKSCSDLGRVLVLNDPAAWRKHRPDCFTVLPRAPTTEGRTDGAAADGGYAVSKNSGDEAGDESGGADGAVVGATVGRTADGADGAVCYLLLRRGISRRSLFSPT